MIQVSLMTEPITHAASHGGSPNFYLFVVVGLLIVWTRFLNFRQSSSSTEIKLSSVSQEKQRKAREKRQEYIKAYQFSERLQQKLAQKHPTLNDDQKRLVFKALRDYFALCLEAGNGRMVSMPSQVVDDAWHEFILFTQHYQSFCGRAFGRFLHHTPAEGMKQKNQAKEGIKRAWRLACAKEGINPQKPDRLPLIFAIDSQLKIEKGFYYTLDCLAIENPSQKSSRRRVSSSSSYCVTQIGCAAGCSGISGSSEGDSRDSGAGQGGSGSHHHSSDSGSEQGCGGGCSSDSGSEAGCGGGSCSSGSSCGSGCGGGCGGD